MLGMLTVCGSVSFSWMKGGKRLSSTYSELVPLHSSIAVCKTVGDAKPAFTEQGKRELLCM